MGIGDFPCSICGNYWCAGHYPTQPLFPSVPYTPTTTTFTWPPEPKRLHPDDIEAIARRVLELMAAEKPAENHWQRLLREWTEWLRNSKEDK